MIFLVDGSWIEINREKQFEPYGAQDCKVRSGCKRLWIGIVKLNEENKKWCQWRCLRGGMKALCSNLVLARILFLILYGHWTIEP